MAIHNKLPMILACTSLLMLSACVSPTVSSGRLTEGGLTVSQLYQQSINEPMPHWSLKQERSRPVNYAGYTASASKDIQQVFKPLANPQVPIYIFPHIALIGDEQLLKPGYTTAFFLYKHNQFALPSEYY